MTATHGEWMGSQQTALSSDGVDPLFILHAILMHTGKVLVWSGHAETGHLPAESYEWDPIANPSMSDPGAVQIRAFAGGTDIFCCHQTNLEDGRVMSVGGSHHIAGQGIRDICIYDPVASSWSKIGDMTVGRWYPTLVTLADGSVLAFSGHDDTGGSLAESVEHFQLPIQGPSYAPTVLAGGDKHLATYPGLHLVAGGRVVMSGTTWRYGMEQPAPIDTHTFRKTGSATGAWTDEVIHPAFPNREEGMSVLLPPAQDGKILVVGGGWWIGGHAAGSDLDSAAILDTQAGPMAWQSLPDMHHPRVNVNIVLLPDGKVLVHGGHNEYKWNSSQVPSLVAELYDPVLNTWTEVDAMTDRRIYHSASLLLPDGSVLAMGGVNPTIGGDGNQRTYEFYRPPYFFKGTRPTIATVTSDHGPADRLAYGNTVTITGTSDTPVLRVALMRPGSMTHHTDSEQRYVPLEFVVTAYDTTTKAFSLDAGVIGDANIAPPGWYMLWVVDDQERPAALARMVHLTRRQCAIVTDRSHIARDELDPAGNTDFADSFYVIMDGFRPDELGVSVPTVAADLANAPTIVFRQAGAAVPTMTATPTAILLEAGAGVPQRIAFRYTIRFVTDDVFDDAGNLPIEDQEIEIEASKNGFECHAPLRLTDQPRPFMLDGDPHWLSTDLRVFALQQNAPRFGHNVGNSPADSLTFINNVLNDFNANPATGETEFNNILTPQDQSPVYLSELFPGTSDRVYNFAIAKVRYRARNLPANDVGVFFRLFRVLATGVEFHASSTYLTIVNDAGQRIPALGIQGGQVTTIPFFAEARVNTSSDPLTEQHDSANRKNLAAVDPGDDERVAFFGCWLDINQTALRFPPNTTDPVGPYSSGLDSIQELLRGVHCCLVAEVDFGTGWLQDGDSPAGNDSLSQRNLAVIGSDNPGSPATHTVVHTFEIKRSPAMGIGVPLAKMRDFETVLPATRFTDRNPPRLLHRRADELMIEWGNLPEGTRATIYMPGISADEVADLHGRRPGPDNIKPIDPHTLALTVGARRVTYLPLPSSRHATIAALFSIELPDGVRKDNRFHLTVRQIDGTRRTILGAVEWVIPVTDARRLLPEESSRLGVLRHIARKIPASDQWAPVFGRYIEHQADKVRGLGGDPDRIEPSPQGYVPGTGPAGGGDSDHRLCCRLRYLVAIFAVLLVLALVLPGPPGLKAAVALISGAVIIASLVVGLIRCPCPDERL